jgi:AcrR family transcriptional regulator
MTERRRGRPRGRTKAETRTRILSAARVCFGQFGYDAATNAMIADLAAISPAAIYQHFASKRDLYAAVAADSDRLIANAYALAAATSESLQSTMLAVIDVSRDLHARDPSLAQFVFARPMEAGRHEELAALPHGLDTAAPLRMAAERAALSGEIRPSVAPDDIADALWLVLIGLGRYAQAAADLAEYERMVGACRALFVAGRAQPGDRRTRSSGAAASINGARAPAPLGALDSVGQPNGASTRDRLVGAAIESFGQRGYASTALLDVARRAGLTTGAVYGNFESKQALYVAAVRHAEAVVETHLRGFIGEESLLERRSSTFLDGIVDLSERFPSLTAFRVNVSVELARHREVGRAVGDELDRRVAFCRQLVSSASDTSWLADEDLTLLLLASGDGAAWFSRFGPRGLAAPVGVLKELLFGRLFALAAPSRSAG